MRWLMLTLFLGQPLVFADGYMVLWGTTEGVYDRSVDVKQVTHYELTGLTPGQRYYIVAKYYDGLGMLSPASNMVSGVAPATGRIPLLWDPPGQGPEPLLVPVERVRVGVE